MVIASADFMAGNLHLNVVAEKYSAEVEAALEPFVYELVGEYHCSRVETSSDVLFRITSRFYFCRTWDWADEGSCATLLKKPREYRTDEKDQELVR